MTSIHKHIDSVVHRCYSEKGRICHDSVPQHRIAYIISGEMLVQNGSQSWIVRAGEAAFIKRDHKIHLTKQPAEGKPFCGVFLHLDQTVFKKLLGHIRLPDYRIGQKTPSLVPIQHDRHVQHFFEELDRYFAADQDPDPAWMQEHIREIISILLQQTPALVPVLFDFYVIWKPSLDAFMEENYKEDLSLEEYARYTGRSLSAFKRDFWEHYGETPARWIMRRRLEDAHRMLAEGRHASDIYLELGFKCLSHFSTAFKRQYGINPTQVKKQ